MFSVCKVDWDVSVHDGPVTAIVPSPFVKHLTLTVGGYSWALWKEDRDIVSQGCISSNAT
jgi:hypothetical protein